MFIDTANLSCFVWLSSASRPLGVSASSSQWGVGQLADRPAVNREVGGSSPPAPVGSPRRTSPLPRAYHLCPPTGQVLCSRCACFPSPHCWRPGLHQRRHPPARSNTP